MLTDRFAPRLRTLLVAAIAAAFALIGAVAAAPPALAHDELVSTDPAADTTMAELPAELTLTFSSEIADDEGANVVEVTDETGADLTDGALSVRDNILTQPLSGPASGAVTVLWKVVSSDGHPISGEFSFTVEQAQPTPVPTVTVTITPTPEPTASESPTATATPEPVAAAGSSPWPWIIGIVLAAGLVAGVVYLIVARPRRAAAGGDASGGASDGAGER